MTVFIYYTHGAGIVDCTRLLSFAANVLTDFSRPNSKYNISVNPTGGYCILTLTVGSTMGDFTF